MWWITTYWSVDCWRRTLCQVKQQVTPPVKALVSDATVDELVDVLARPEFDSYVTLGERKGFIERLLRIAERVTILRQVQACRDPGDDKFLEIAIKGEADTMVTGDRDLLILHPFMGIPIPSPADFLAKTRPTRGKNPQVQLAKRFGIMQARAFHNHLELL